MQALPVIDMILYERVKARSAELGGTPFPFFEPTIGPIITKMQRVQDWSMLYCFKNSSFFYSGCLYHNWNKTSLKDSILGVERTFTDWYAVDIYVYDNTTLFHLPFEKRRELLEALSQEHNFKLERDLPDCMGSRLFTSFPVAAS